MDEEELRWQKSMHKIMRENYKDWKTFEKYHFENLLQHAYDKLEIKQYGDDEAGVDHIEIWAGDLCLIQICKPDELGKVEFVERPRYFLACKYEEGPHLETYYLEVDDVYDWERVMSKGGFKDDESECWIHCKPCTQDDVEKALGKDFVVSVGTGWLVPAEKGMFGAPDDTF